MLFLNIKSSSCVSVCVLFQGEGFSDVTSIEVKVQKPKENFNNCNVTMVTDDSITCEMSLDSGLPTLDHVVVRYAHIVQVLFFTLV